MKEILVISGKGGTGKTSLTASFAAIAEKKVMVDCDVDAADLYLLLNSEIIVAEDFSGSKLPVIDADKCIMCGKCENICRFGAIEDFAVVSWSCEGCEACYHVCPVGAISLQDRLSGKWFISRTKYGPLVHAALGIAEENSGKLVAEVRKRAREVAEEKDLDLIIVDGPPGIGCPVISSLSGIDLALIVTEPTVAGVHDLERIVKVARHFEVEPLVCINKFDLEADESRRLELYCQKEGVEIVGRLGFDPLITKAMVDGKPLTEAFPESRLAQEIGQLWADIQARF